MEPETFFMANWWLGMMVAWLLVLVPLWIILRRAGFSGGWALLALLGPLGLLVALAILAFRPWPTAPWSDGARP